MKKHHITINPSVYKKLEEIFSYIASESPSTALKIIDEIEEKIMSLESMPERFAVIPEKISYKNYQIRHFFCKKSFRIIYTICGNEVRILDVRHTAQDYFVVGDISY